MKKISTLLFFIIAYTGFSQIDVGNLMGVPIASSLTDITGLSGVNNGSLVYVDSEKSMYIYNNTSWVKVIDNSPVITNEIMVEDDDYLYVSVLIDGTDWQVTRFHKNDINTETTASGNGTQPTTLTAIAALTYN